MKTNFPLLLFLLILASFFPVSIPFACATVEPESFQKGLRYYIMRNYESAAEQWIATLSAYPGHKKAKIYLEKAYTKSKEIKDKYFQAVEYFDKGDCENAINGFSSVIMLSPRYRDTIPLLKRAYEMCGLNVMVRTSSNGGGSPFTNKIVSIDDEYSLYASVYKQEHFVGDLPFAWEVFGSRSSDVSSRLMIAFLKLGDLGHISLYSASNENKLQWDSGMIQCVMGAAASVKVVKLSDGGNPNNSIVSAENPLTLVAYGYDRAANFLKAIPVQWTVYSNRVPDDRLIMDKHAGSSLDLLLTKSGRSYSVKAERYGLDSVIVTNIRVIPGAPSYVIIEDHAQGGGEIFNRTLLPGEKISLFSIAYDKNNNRIGPFNVQWNGAKGLEKSIPQTKGEMIVYEAVENASGTIKAVPSEGVDGDETGLLTTRVFAIGSLRIMDSEGAEVSNKTIGYEDSLSLNAGIFDTTGKFIKFVKADWSMKSDDSTLVASTNLFSIAGFSAAKVNVIDCSVNLPFDSVPAKPEIVPKTNDKMMKRWTDHALILVSAPIIRSIKIAGPGKDGVEQNPLVESRMTIDEKQSFEVIGYDVKGISRGRLKAGFEYSPIFSTISSNAYFQIVPEAPGSDKLRVRFTNTIKDLLTADLLVDVLPGQPRKAVIIFDNKTNREYYVTNTQSLESLKLAGFDKRKNFTGWLPATWSMNGVVFDPVATHAGMNDLIVTALYDQLSADAALHVAFHQDVEFLADNDVVKYEIVTNDILYKIAMKTLAFSAGYKQIMPQLKAIGRFNGVRNINLIFPKKFVLFPYVRVKNTVSSDRLAEYLDTAYGVKRYFIFGRAAPFGAVSSDDKIIIFDTNFLENGYGFFKNKKEGKR